jgi:hypothetical protein
MRWRYLPGAVGMVLALASVALAIAPEVVSVRQDQLGYTIDGHWLGARGDGVYQGQSGVMVEKIKAGTFVAAGSSALNGHVMLGKCIWVESSPIENCRFSIGARTLRAKDERTFYGWTRQYDDGEQVELLVQNRDPVLVPFAVGLVNGAEF